ncbi:calcium-binding protein [Sphingomonas lenta]|uniref:Calcium-binding protein n=1 Tax=Sphingomonas lenta TaxID=1141887 RepID=A0A2A2SCV8_9SPHN|nr:calcium-binding protein [Sphingomonas lenta]PAX07086.1 hypothetical protein CKY28_13645 [Sphingomonas lenta]
MRFSEAGARYRNAAVITDGVQIDATGVELVNTESGRIVGGVTFAAGGSTVINEAGGIIRVADGAEAHSTAAVTGSAGADTLVNAGSIIGRIDLGAGDDRYESRGAASAAAEGGAGRDRAAFTVTDQGVRYGTAFTGFEELALTGNGQFVGFSGYQAITLGAPLDYGMGLIDSLNPAVDLLLAGNRFRLHASSLRSVAGGDAAEGLELSNASVVSGAVSLGGGDDVLWLNRFGTAAAPTLPGGGADGGTGRDTLRIDSYSAGGVAYDLATVAGFETLSINAGYVQKAAFDIGNADGFGSIELGTSSSLTLRSSASPGANLSGGSGGAISLDAESAIGRYGFPLAPGWDQRVDIQQADDRQSVVFSNRGAVGGEMRFYVGDDLYDGREGRVGGAVYGNAGNDTLLGGAGAERFEGGFGADRLEGGDGADTLVGGAGGDLLDGGRGVDRLEGGAGDDRFVVDEVGDAIVEAVGEGFDTLTVTQGSYLLSGGASVELLSAAAGTASINIGGNEQSQRLEGNDGANILSSGGGGGVDTMAGGLGDDTYRVFATGDVIEDTGGFDTVYASGTSYFLYSTAAVEYLSNSDQAGTEPIYLVGNGASQVIAGNYGNNILNGRGGDGQALPDTLIGLFGNDTYGVFSQGDVVREQAGQGADVVYASASYQLRQGTEVEALAAINGSAADAASAYTLRGNEVGQTVVGNAAANVVDGRGGADTLVGLGGADTFAFTTAPGTSNVDTIQDFGPEDLIGLASDVFAGVADGGVQAGELALGTAAQDGDDRLVYDQATGRLFYDADGSGAGAAVLFAQLAAGTVLTAASFTIVQPVGDIPAA